MESINGIGVKPTYINTTYPANEAVTADENRSTSQDQAVYIDISKEAKSLTGNTPTLDKSKLLELLGPSVSEKYSDLIVSVSKNNNRIQSFINKVNDKVDLLA